MDGLQSLALILAEGTCSEVQADAGAEYLIDVAIVECVIWQAEVIDPGHGAVLKRELQQAVQAELDLAGWVQGV
jgi:hypothetical protein